MWEFREGDTKFYYVVKLVLRKDLGSIVHPATNYYKYYSYQHYALNVPTLLALFIFAYNFSYHSTNTLENTLIFLKCMVNEHVFMSLVSLGIKFSLHYLKFEKIVRVSGISTTCTD